MNKVTVILPTYNESGNIIPLVEKIIEYIPDAYDFEIIVVDDNSPDGTYMLVQEQLGTNPKVIPILRTNDRGLAKSIKAGISKASGDTVIVMDTDFTHDPAEIPKLLHIGQLYDIVSGSRFCPGGRMQDAGHYVASMFFNVFLRLFLRTQIQDNLGGFWCMSTHNLMRLPLERIFYGYGDYFFRLLHYAQRIKMSIVEIPAIYTVRMEGTSKSNFIRMLYRYSIAMLRLKKEIVLWEKHTESLHKAIPNPEI